MTERRVPWNQILWTCPSCEGPLEPVSSQDREELPDDWRESPRSHADNPAVECIDCERQYGVQFIPRGMTDLQLCPDCGGRLEMGSISTIQCESCEQEYEIRERAWLEPVTD